MGRCWLSGVFAVWASCAAAQLDDGLYAAFDTSMGGFTCRLDYAEAPMTCANFVGLAEGSKVWVSTNGAVKTEPFYDGLIFHRVIDGFMIQGGCPLGTGTSGPGYAFPDEFSTNLTHHSAGILSMANSGPDSNGSQFFITLNATDWLDGVHSVFGEVVDGMEVVSDIGLVAVDGSIPLFDVVMNSVRILRVGEDAQSFDPLKQPLPEVTPLVLTLAGDASVMTVNATSSNRCSCSLYNSFDLTTWGSYASTYWSLADGDWSVLASTNKLSEFFRGARVSYAQDVTLFENMVGREFVFTQGTSELYFYLTGEGDSGDFMIAGSADSIFYWDDWTEGAYPGVAVFGTENYSYLKFELRVNGTCAGYQWRQDEETLEWYWLDIGEWTVEELFPD